MRWTVGRAVYAGAAVQFVAMLGVEFVPALLVYYGAYVLAVGVVGGFVAGLLLSRYPLGPAWGSQVNGYEDAAFYGAAATVLADAGYFAFLAVVSLVSTRLARGFWAPVVILVSEFVAGVAVALGNVTLGAAGGLAGMFLGGVLARARGPGRRV